MDTRNAIDAFSALAQDTRLKVFRWLVEAGFEGIPAGDIAREFGVPHNTLSAHLTVLSRAGLVSSRKDGRSVIYAANFEGVRALMAFLLQDCCKGRPEVCAPLLDAALGPISALCCAPTATLEA